MNTQFFKYAIEVERTRSITKAAENLFMAQPNLSKNIKELEDTLGFTIFERTSRGVAPTKRGGKFLQYAHTIVEQLSLIDSIVSEADLDTQTFRISIPRGSYIAHGFTSFVKELDGTRGMDVTIRETNSMETINSVSDRSSQLGIIRYQNNYEKYFLDYLLEKHLCYQTVWEFEYRILFSKDHPLAEVETLREEDFRDYIEIVHGDTMIPYLSAENGGRGGTVPREKKRVCLYERGNQFDLLSKIPTTYMWVSPIPEELLSLFCLVQRSCISEGNRHKDVLIYPEGYRFTELDKKYIDKLYTSKNAVAFQS